jgi:AraC-like DNA-binding protein
LFRQAFNKTPHQYLIERRIEKAKELLEPTERPYGIEAVFKDNSGNWFSLTEPR